MLKKLATMLANILAKKKQYCVQNNMLNVKNNTAATSLLNFNDQSLAKKKKKIQKISSIIFLIRYLHNN